MNHPDMYDPVCGCPGVDGVGRLYPPGSWGSEAMTGGNSTGISDLATLSNPGRVRLLVFESGQE
jgi:hypothetical protein